MINNSLKIWWWPDFHQTSHGGWFNWCMGMLEIFNGIRILVCFSPCFWSVCLIICLKNGEKMVCFSVHKNPLTTNHSILDIHDIVISPTGFAKKITLKSNLKSYFSKGITVSTLCMLHRVKKSLNTLAK